MALVAAHRILPTMGYLLFAILLLTFSIFVHELGHFLVARWRGLVTPRFSLFGIGNPIWKWNWRGVEYCICWLPFGAYVMIPQLADLGEFEGDMPDEYRNLPKAGYLSIVLVALAGPIANILLAFTLACVVWQVGIKIPAEFNRTEIGEVVSEITNSEGQRVKNPAATAGLQAGDIITAVDGKPVQNFADVWNAVMLSGNVTAAGRRLAVVTYTRDGVTHTTDVFPELVGFDAMRSIAIAPRFQLILGELLENYPAKSAGLKSGDRILAINGKPLKSRSELSNFLQENKDAPVKLSIQRLDQTLEVSMTPAIRNSDGRSAYILGINWPIVTIHKTPFEQFAEVFRNIGRTFSTLFNRNSDVGIRHMSSVIGIVDNLQAEAEAGLPNAFAMLLMINLSLAIFNLLPIPVLDGGHIAMATITKLRGRSIPAQWIRNSTQICFLILIGFILYVSFFDSRRTVHNRLLDDAPPPVATPDKPKEPGK